MTTKKTATTTKTTAKVETIKKGHRAAGSRSKANKTHRARTSKQPFPFTKEDLAEIEKISKLEKSGKVTANRGRALRAWVKIRRKAALAAKKAA